MVIALRYPEVAIWVTCLLNSVLIPSQVSAGRSTYCYFWTYSHVNKFSESNWMQVGSNFAPYGSYRPTKISDISSPSLTLSLIDILLIQVAVPGTSPATRKWSAAAAWQRLHGHLSLRHRLNHRRYRRKPSGRLLPQARLQRAAVHIQQERLLHKMDDLQQ